ncbi:MAG: transposase [bacterium]|nr:transposase [bacterium]
MRKDILANGEIYHVMNKSIAGFRIFQKEGDFFHMKNLIRYYTYAGVRQKYSQFLRDVKIHKENIEEEISRVLADKDKSIQVICYGLMPTHFHLVVKQLKEHGIEKYLSDVSNAYARYFNTKIERKGPLWVGRFQSVNVSNDNHFLHLTRYIHLNPVSAGLVKKASDWPYSSFLEYVKSDSVKFPVCDYSGLMPFSGKQYEKFTNDQANYQKELAQIKALCLE